MCTTAGTDLESRTLHVLGATQKARIELFNGREHYVVPVVALMEGVIHAVNADDAEFVPAEVLKEAAESWNGKPVMLGHPVRDGRQCSAEAPDVILESGLGVIRNSRFENKKLLQEAWVEKTRVELLHSDLAKRIMEAEPVEVSVGALVRTASKDGMHKQKKYKGVWKMAQGDHLAFLPGGRGACSIEMGCGTNRAAAMRMCEDDMDLEILGGAGSGWFAKDGHVPGSQGGKKGGQVTHASASTLHSDAARSAEHAASAFAGKLQFQHTDKVDHAKYAKTVAADSKAALAASKALKGEKYYGYEAAGTYHKLASEAIGKGDYKSASKYFKEMAGHHAGLARVHGAYDRIKNQNKKLKLISDSRRLASHDIEFVALSEMSLDDQMNAIHNAVREKYSDKGSSDIHPSHYSYAVAIFDDHVIIRKEDNKLYRCNYSMKDGKVTFEDGMTEVRMAYVAVGGDKKSYRASTVRLEGGKWTVYSTDGTRRLAYHASEADAIAHAERIEEAKQRRQVELLEKSPVSA